MTDQNRDQNRFLLLYGSQTGQAKAIAEQICEKCLETGYSPDIKCVSGSDKTFNITNESIVVIVVSTTGDGEPPDTVSKFWRKLKKRSNPPDMLKNLQYGLLGLGDSNYTNFCNMGKMLNERLLQLGAVSFYETGYADDGVGLEIVVEPWMAGLLPALASVFSPVSCNSTHNSTSTNDGKEKVVTDRNEQVVVDGNKVQAVQTAADTSICVVNDVTQLSLEEPPVVESHVLLDSVLRSTESTLRGTDDSSWQLKPFTVLSYPPSYIDLDLIQMESLSLFKFTEAAVGASATVCPSVVMARILNRRVLTSPDAQKETLELKLSWTEDCLKYEPGDALCIVCPNDPWEVQYLIERLNLVQEQDYAMSLSISKETSKRNPVIPKHIPSSCTVSQYLKHCANIRAVLKKSVLLGLSEYCSVDIEKKRLQWLSSREGSQDYNRLVVEAHLDILDILNTFPSCSPPLSRLVEFFPRLQPRYYSVASSPLVCAQGTSIVFNVTVLPDRTWYKHRNGLCSGWLANVSVHCPTEPIVPVFARLRNPFALPSDNLLPIVMIGPGTGIAPFIGFLEHRLALQNAGVSVGPSWLFFGCRHPDRDYLYKERLSYFASQAGRNILTHHHTSFSRLDDNCPAGEQNFPKYVQDNLRKHKDKLSKWIMEDGAVVFVCGDAKHMAVNIKEAIVDVIQYYIDLTGRTRSSAHDVLQELVENQRYIVDQWI